MPWVTALRVPAALVSGALRQYAAEAYDTLTLTWRMWVPIHIATFSVVPVPFRVLYNNTLSLGWNAFLSNLNSKRLEDVVVRRLLRPAK